MIRSRDGGTLTFAGAPHERPLTRLEIEMTPSLTRANHRNGVRRDTEPPRQVNSNAKILRRRKDFANLILSQLMRRCTLTGRAATSPTPLFYHILNVLGLCPEKQMLRSDASAVSKVAFRVENIAIVTEEEFSGNMSDQKSPSETSSYPNLALVANLPIAVTLPSAGVRPAGVSLRDISPKLVFAVLRVRPFAKAAAIGSRIFRNFGGLAEELTATVQTDTINTHRSYLSGAIPRRLQPRGGLSLPIYYSIRMPE